MNGGIYIMWEVLKCRLDLVLANKKEMFMDNFRQKASEAAVLLRSRSFLVTMLAAITGFLTLWITLSADAVYIRDNGQLQLVYTTRNTADAILSERGIVTMAYDDVDFSGFDLRGAIPEIEITRAFDVTLTTDEGSMVVKTTGGTVGEVLNANGIEYDENDMISYPPGMYVQPGDEIVYQEVVVEQSVEQEPIEHETEYRGSSLLPRGRTRVIQAGSDGERELTYNKTIVDGEVTRTELESNVVTEQPVTEIILQGTADPVSPLDFGYQLSADGTPVNYAYKLTDQVATGYSARSGAWGASGMTLSYGYVAVDPTEIPYGSKLYITSSDGSFVYGYAIAADTGTGLLNDVIDVDLFYETYTESCLNGRRTVDIYVLA